MFHVPAHKATARPAAQVAVYADGWSPERERARFAASMRRLRPAMDHIVPAGVYIDLTDFHAYVHDDMGALAQIDYEPALAFCATEFTSITVGLHHYGVQPEPIPALI